MLVSHHANRGVYGKATQNSESKESFFGVNTAFRSQVARLLYRFRNNFAMFPLIRNSILVDGVVDFLLLS